MREIRGELWDYWDLGSWVVVTVNGAVRYDGACVMGRGIAKEAAIKFPDLPYRLGDRIRQHGNRVYTFSQFRLFTFPVKRVWSEKASMPLIRESAAQLVRLVDQLKLSDVYCVRPGCGNGGLDWTDVGPELAKFFDQRFAIVERR
jgi:hypothetical protein